MAPLDYQILSKLMSYVFTLLGVIIVLRAFIWLRKDRQATHKRLKALPDAGFIGVLTVLQGSSELPEGTAIPVPWEGVLGFVRTCDVVVPVDDVIAKHLDFTFRNGKGLYIYPRRGCPVAVDGVPIDSQADSRRYPMQHGSLLQVGEALLQLGVFAGLDVQQTGGWAEPQPEPDEEPLYPGPWQPGSAFAEPGRPAAPSGMYPLPSLSPHERRPGDGA